jgi:hypothetical protein
MCDVIDWKKTKKKQQQELLECLLDQQTLNF